MAKMLLYNSPIYYPVRREMYQGKAYLVAPIVALVEGVHIGVAGAFYYPLSEIAASAAGWNGMPLTANHPEQNGEMVAVNTPGVAERYVVGLCRNMRFEDNRLKGEAWVEIELANGVNPSIIAKLEAGAPMELSTGLFADNGPGPGVWNGESYENAAVNFVPDHIALLPEDVGACSIADGCGVRVNKGESQNNHSGEDKMSKIAKIFAAVAAWIKGNEASFDQIKDKLRVFINGLDSPEYINFLQDVFPDYFVYETMRRNNMTGTVTASQLFKRSYNQNEAGEITVADDATEVVEKREYVPVSNAAEPKNPKEQTTVNAKTKEIPEMDKKKEKIDALIACNCTRFEEKDRAFLSTLTEEQLELLKAPENVIVKPEEPPKANAQTDPPKPADPPKPPETPVKKTVTANEYVEQAPAEVREVLEDALIVNKAIKTGIIEKLLANKACEFTKEELAGMKVNELRRLAKLAAVEVGEPDFSGQAGAGLRGNESGAPDMPPTFTPLEEKKK